MASKLKNVPPRQATLCCLIQRQQGAISQICLAMKKRGFGQGKWNGAGGKVEPGESVEAAMVRETAEEIHVTPIGFFKAAELDFKFPHQPGWNQTVHVYLAHQWIGEPGESAEMKPAWLSIPDIPYGLMWPDDKYWLPRVLAGEFVSASFSFNAQENIIDYSLTSFFPTVPA